MLYFWIAPLLQRNTSNIPELHFLVSTLLIKENCVLFFSPLWLFALPLASLLGSLAHSKTTSNTHSIFFIFVISSNKLERKFYFSTQNWFLKLLRSLLIIVLVLTLSKPYWQTQSSIPEYWIIDDTHSVLHTQALEHLDNYKNRELGFTQAARLVSLRFISSLDHSTSI